MGRLYLPSSEDPEPEETDEVAVANAADGGPTGERTGRIYVGVTANVVPVEEPEDSEVDGEVVDVKEPAAVQVPEGTLDERVAWVAEGETSDERAARASAVYAHEKDTAGLEEQKLEALSADLTAAVHGPVDEPAGTASRADWVAYAASKGAPEEETKPKDEGGLGRDALREKYGSKS